MASIRRHSSSVSRTSASSGVFTPPLSASCALARNQRLDAAQVVHADRARVVDQDVDRAELGLDALDRGIDRRAVGHVADERQTLAAGELDGLLGRLEPNVKRRHARALGGQPPHDRAADPGAAAGDHRHACLQGSCLPRFSGDGDDATADVAGLKPLIRGGDVFESDALDLDPQHAGAGEVDDLGEFGARAPVREHDRGLERDRAKAQR